MREMKAKATCMPTHKHHINYTRNATTHKHTHAAKKRNKQNELMYVCTNTERTSNGLIVTAFPTKLYTIVATIKR